MITARNKVYVYDVKMKKHTRLFLFPSFLRIRAKTRSV